MQTKYDGTDGDFLDSILIEIPKADAPNTSDKSEAKKENKLAIHERLNDAEIKAIERTENWRDSFYACFKWGFYLYFVVFVIITIVMTWHWLAPNYWHWLNTHQLDNLKNILLAIFASNAISTWLTKIK